MKRRTYEDFKQEIIKALTNPEPKTCDAYVLKNIDTTELSDYFYKYHRIRSEITNKVLRELVGKANNPYEWKMKFRKTIEGLKEQA